MGHGECGCHLEMEEERQSKQKITVLPPEALKSPHLCGTEFWKNLSERAGREADEPADVP